MATNKLTERDIARQRTPGKYGDGGGLYLRVTKAGTKQWLFIYDLAGRRREMGLGGLADVPLATARTLAARHRQAIVAGRDPLADRQHDQAATPSAPPRRRAAKTPVGETFRDCAERYIAANAPTWKSAKHHKQWQTTLANYAYPRIGDRPVDAVAIDDVVAILTPIWSTATTTADRVRARIEKILDAATVLGLRRGDNPARWRGQLEMLLPGKSAAAHASRQRAGRPEHFAALPWQDVPALIDELRDHPSVAAPALRFTILTAARTEQTLGATWREISGEPDGEMVWTIPASRMKGKVGHSREHRVPLSPAATAVITEMRHDAGGAPAPDAPIFRGTLPGQGLCVNSMRKFLQTLRPDTTPHGFRSAFKDWAHETTDFGLEVIEMALSHAIANAVEAAYRRGNLFAKRRDLMAQWAQFCDSARESFPALALVT